MTAYEYDNLPAGDELMIDAVPEELFELAHAAFLQALNSGLAKAHEAKVAFVYDRKGYLTADTFGGTRNASYGRDTDDVVIQMTIRVPSPKTVGNLDLHSLTLLEERVIEHNTSAERARLEAEIAAEEAAAEKAQAAAKQKREQLEALRKK